MRAPRSSWSPVRSMEVSLIPRLWPSHHSLVDPPMTGDAHGKQVVRVQTGTCSHSQSVLSSRVNTAWSLLSCFSWPFSAMMMSSDMLWAPSQPPNTWLMMCWNASDADDIPNKHKPLEAKQTTTSHERGEIATARLQLNLVVAHT